MTKYEACEQLEKWGLIWKNRTGYPLLEDLLPFAESLAEKRWPITDTLHRIHLILNQRSYLDHNGTVIRSYYAEIYHNVKYPTTYWAEGNDPWWAVFNLIQKMMEG
jgi:hypothetical protein